MKKWKQLSAILIVTLLLVTMLPLAAYAADDGPMFLVYSNGEEKGIGYAVNENGTVYLAAPYYEDDPSLYIVDTNGDSHYLQRQFWIGTMFAFYTVDGSQSVLRTHEIVCPRKGETVTVQYAVRVNGNLQLDYTDATVAEIARDYEDGTVQLRLNPQGTISEELMSTIPMLAMLDGRCVGVVSHTSNGWQVYVDWFDPSVYNNAVTSTPAPTQAPTPAPTQAPTQAPAEPVQPGSLGALTQPTPTPAPASSGGKTALVVVMALITVALFVALAVVLRKKDKQPAGGYPNNNYPGNYPSDPYGSAPAGYGTTGYTGAPNDYAQAYTGDNVTAPYTGDNNTVPLDSAYAAPQAPAEPQALFLACGSGQSAQIYPISRDLKLGTAPDSNIRYPDGCPGISAEHATLTLQDGMLFLTDSSAEGTFLQRLGSEGQAPSRIPAGVPIALQVGDVFYLGNEQNRFQIVNQ